MRQLVFLMILLVLSSLQAEASSCQLILETSASTAVSPESFYLKLLKVLVEQKNAFSDDELSLLADQRQSVDPLSLVISRLSSAERFSFSRAFTSSLIGGDLDDTAATREYILKSLAERRKSALIREKAKADTASAYFPVVKAEVFFPRSWGVSRTSRFLPDGRLLILSIEAGLPTILTIFDSKSKMVTQKKFRKNLDARVFTSTSGETLVLKWNEDGRLSLSRLQLDNRLISLKISGELPTQETSLTALGENALKHPCAVFTENINLFGTRRVKKFIEVDLISGEKNEFPVDYSETGTRRTFGSEDAHVLKIRVVDGYFILRDLSRGGAPVRIRVPHSLTIFLNEILAPTSDRLYLPFSAQGKVMWFDFKTGIFSDLSGETRVLSNPLLLIPHEGSYLIPTDTFGSIVLPIKGGAQTFENSRWLDTRRIVKPLKLKNGRSILVMAYEPTVSIVSRPVEILDLDSGVLLALQLGENKRATLLNAYETKAGTIEGLFETRDGLKVIQLYGPLE